MDTNLDKKKTIVRVATFATITYVAYKWTQNAQIIRDHSKKSFAEISVSDSKIKSEKKKIEALKVRPDDETTYLPKAPNSFQRGANKVQNWIDKDGDFLPESNRYHLFLNYGCGWSHQVLEVLVLCKLQGSIGVTHVGCYRGSGRGTPKYQGYVIQNDTSGFNLICMRDVYNAFDNKYGVKQLTIPVLFDKKTKRVVSNDPAQILLMLDFWANELRGGGESVTTLYPEALREEIEKINSVVFPGINNGVYCCWFGRDAAFDEGFDLVQNGLQWLEDKLSGSDSDGKPRLFLCGTDQPTLADVRAFPHLFRFDGIYYELMLQKMGARIFGKPGEGKPKFPLLADWIKRMFDIVKESCDLQVATRFYFSSLPVEESDAIYDREREATGGWLPSIEEWAKKRAEEGIVDTQIDIPAKRP